MNNEKNKQVIGLVFETLEEAQWIVRNNFPEAKTGGYPYIVTTDMFVIIYVPAYKSFRGRRFNHLFTTKEIQQSEWFKAVVKPMMIPGIAPHIV